MACRSSTVQMQASLLRKLYILTSRQASDGHTLLSWCPEPNCHPAAAQAFAMHRQALQTPQIVCGRRAILRACGGTWPALDIATLPNSEAFRPFQAPGQMRHVHTRVPCGGKSSY